MFSRLRRVVRPLAPLAVAVQSTHLDPHMVHAFSSAKANLSNLPLEGTYVQTTSAFSIAANDPLEDRFSLAKLREDKVLAAVMDGHGGWQCANFVQNNLYEAVAAELTHSTNADDPHEVGAALTRAFERVDRDFLGRIRPAFQIGFGRVSNVGACAIAAIVTHSHIIVANAGDCRAVFGRTVAARESSLANATGSDSDSTTNSNAVAVFGGSAGAWIETTALSYDHNSRLPREQAHLRIAHPDEPDLVVEKGSGACYVKGRLQPTRAFGDAYLKQSEFNAPAASDWGRHIPPPYTPPYITAKPEIRVLPLHNGATGYSVAEGLRKSFLILACDGVWDVLSNEDAVRFVAQDTGPRESVAERLAQRVLEAEAEAAGLGVADVRAMPLGRKRRALHDDITVVVLFVGPKSPAEGAPVGTSVSISGGLLAALKRAIGL